MIEKITIVDTVTGAGTMEYCSLIPAARHLRQILETLTEHNGTQLMLVEYLPEQFGGPPKNHIFARIDIELEGEAEAAEAWLAEEEGKP